jgi:hypothetical protein
LAQGFHLSGVEAHRVCLPPRGAEKFTERICTPLEVHEPTHGREALAPRVRPSQMKISTGRRKGRRVRKTHALSVAASEGAVSFFTAPVFPRVASFGSRFSFIVEAPRVCEHRGAEKFTERICTPLEVHEPTHGREALAPLLASSFCLEARASRARARKAVVGKRQRPSLQKLADGAFPGNKQEGRARNKHGSRAVASLVASLVASQKPPHECLVATCSQERILCFIVISSEKRWRLCTREGVSDWRLCWRLGWRIGLARVARSGLVAAANTPPRARGGHNTGRQAVRVLAISSDGGGVTVHSRKGERKGETKK